MISVNFNIANPWSYKFENLWCRSYETWFENKFIELELIKDASIVSFMFKLATRQDHGGLYIELGLMGYSFNFNFYDNRHWDYKNGCYYSYNKEGDR